MEPDVLRKREGIQLSYGLPQRLTGACVYPRKPTNGSTVIICAHEQGLRVLWYGGKRPKQDQHPAVNGDSIDLTEEVESTTVDYETDYEEVDPSRPFHGIISYKDIILGTTATKIAVPPLGPEQTDDLPTLLNSHAVVLVACADYSLRLIAIPLEPANFRETKLQQIAITGASSHQDLISSVAITITAATLEEEESRQSRAESRSRNPQNNDNINSSTQKEWSMLLASTSPTGTGLLLIHQVPLLSNGRISDIAEDLVPVQRRFLRSSLLKCYIEFNSSLYPSHRHSNLLVASSDDAAVKIYQALPPTTSSKRRRGSTTTIDSTTSAGHSITRRNAATGKVLINMLVPFGQIDSIDFLPSRRRVLDAKWVLHGRAVLVLLEDGEWGIWDIEGAGPSTSTTGNLVRGQSTISGVQGGSITKFAIRGNLNAGSTTKQTSGISTKPTSDSSLALMTPHTRKTRSQGLFKGQTESGASNVLQTVQSGHGSIAVVVQPTTIAGTRTQDESIIFNYGSKNVLVTSIQSYWRTENSDKGAFDGSTSARPVNLPTIQTAGEEQTSVQHLPQVSGPAGDGLFAVRKSAQDFIAVTSSRLIMFVAPLTESTLQHQTSSLPTRLLTGPSTRKDQMLLDSGELDVDGMDRILNNMANSGTVSETNAVVSQNHFARKSVGFQLDNDDEDMDLGSPTASKGQRNKLTVNKSSATSNGARRLFT